MVLPFIHCSIGKRQPIKRIAGTWPLHKQGCSGERVEVEKDLSSFSLLYTANLTQLPIELVVVFNLLSQSDTANNVPKFPAVAYIPFGRSVNVSISSSLPRVPSKESQHGC